MVSNKKKNRLYSAVLSLGMVAVMLASSIFAVAFPILEYKNNSGSELKNGFQVTNISDELKVKPSSKYVLTHDEQVKELKDNDKIKVIVVGDTNGMIDIAQKQKTTLADYVATEDGALEQDCMRFSQQSTKNSIAKAMQVEFEYDYTTLFNGFSAEINYGDLARLRSIVGEKNVIVSEQYLAPKVDATNNDVLVYGTGIYDSSKIGYTGAGTVAAVIDSGLDYTHSAFKNQPTELALTRDDVASVLNESSAYKFKNGLTVEDVYVSDKIPFAFDYGDKDTDVYTNNDHGTHVAGIIAGKDNEITGVAVDAQLAIFKVFSNYATGAETTSILAAVSDAALLNVDVINMSLGSSCGFTTEPDAAFTQAVYDKVGKAGISLIVAASNDYSAAKGSENGDYNLLSNPDSGTVGSPASYKAAMAVASISGVKSSYAIANNSTAVYMLDASNNLGDKTKFVERMLANQQTTKETYITIPGVGRAGNYTGLDVKNKIAVVQRGIVTFEEKVKTAAAFGAKAVIIYNNVSGNINMSVGNFTDIPACSISMDNGKLLAKMAEGTLEFSKDYLAGPFMSDFSSWGVLPDLELKPEITAHGGEIYSAVAGGYDRISGTSMASPNMAGATTLVRQYIKENFPTLNNVQVTDFAYQLMMSAATPALNEEGNPYSPRKQGAGLAAIYESVNTQAYISVDGINKTKLSLGDDKSKSGKYTLEFNVNNISSDALSYKLDFSAMTESISSDEKTVAEKAFMLNSMVDSSVSVSGGNYSNGIISLAGYATAKVTLQLNLQKGAKDYLNKNFANGMFVEGFVTLKSQNPNNINIGLPWVAFYGDWTQAPIFDHSAYEITDSFEDTDILDSDKLKSSAYGSIPMGVFRYQTGFNSDGTPAYSEGSWGLGDYGYILENKEDKPRPKEDKAAITSSEVGNFKVGGAYLGTLRGAKSVDIEVINDFTGKVIFSDKQYNVRKSYSNGSVRIPGFSGFEVDAKKMGLKDNTKYTIKIKGYLDYSGEQKNIKDEFVSSFFVDSSAPELDSEKLELRIEEKADKSKKYLLDIYAYDNHYLQCMKISTFSGISVTGELINETEFHKNLLPLYSAKNSVNKITYDITSYYNQILRNDSNIYLEFIDYAKNSSSFKIKIPHADADEVNFKATNTSAKIKINQYLDLKQYLDCTTIYDYDDKKMSLWTDSLIWSSSDESVAIVHDGQVCGLKTGSATITVSNPTQTSSADFAITVSDQTVGDITLHELKMSDTSVSLVQGESYDIWFEALPWNFDDSNLTYAWKSTNDKVATVTQDPTNPKKARVVALTDGNATISVSAGTLITGRCSINVGAMFVMEGSVLKSYKGRGDANGVVEVPSNLGARIIYDGAFFNNEYVKKVVLPMGVELINESAFYGMTNLEEVVLPSTVKELPKWAFGWCSSLNKINLENIKKINELAFYQCNLTELFIPKLTYIGPRAFVYNENLSVLDLSGVSYIGDMAFAYCAGLYDATFSPNVRIEASAFAGCQFTSLSLPNNYIGKAAFEGCASLQSVTFTGKNVIIEDKAFNGCAALTGIQFVGSCKKIGANAFYGAAISTLTLPNGLESIGDSAFGVCQNLKEVKLSANTKLNYIFGQAFIGCTKLTDFTCGEDNSYITTSDGIIYDKSMTKLILVPCGKRFGSFTVPDSVRTIGAYAFAGGKGMASGASISNIIMNNVTTVEYGAFYNATSLMTLTAPKLQYIGAYAFYNNAMLKSMPISKAVTIGEYAFANCNYVGANIEQLVLPETLLSLGEGAFIQTRTFKKLVLNSLLTEIPNKCFAENTSLTEIVFNNNLTTIGEQAFASCQNLDNVVLPNSVTSVQKAAFFDCKNLSQLTLSDNLKNIDAGAFQGCVNLATISLPSSVTEIGDSAFLGCSKLTSIVMPSVTKIDGGAFVGTKLTQIDAPELLELGSYIFGVGEVGNVTLTTFNAPKLENIGSYAFYACLGLTTVDMPLVKNVGMSAFYDCRALTSITLPSAININDGAFMLCSKLETVNLPKVQYLGSVILGGTSVKAINLPETLIAVADGMLFGADKVTQITVDKNNKIFYDTDNVLYQVVKGGAQLVAYPNALTAETFVVPENVVRIVSYSFNGNLSLTQVTLPRGLKYVGVSAFENCEKLLTYIFNSPVAPTLEMTYDGENNLNYRNYTALIGTVELKMQYPKNGLGYTDFIYNKMFTTKETTDDVLEDATIAAIDAINKLPKDITLEHKQLVIDARKAYDSVRRSQREKVTNYNILTAAEAKISELSGVDSVTVVINLIDAADTTQKIAEARKAYDALSAEQKLLVTNYDKLVSAESPSNKDNGGCKSSLAMPSCLIACMVGLLLFVVAKKKKECVK